MSSFSCLTISDGILKLTKVQSSTAASPQEAGLSPTGEDFWYFVGKRRADFIGSKNAWFSWVGSGLAEVIGRFLALDSRKRRSLPPQLTQASNGVVQAERPPEIAWAPAAFTESPVLKYASP